MVKLNESCSVAASAAWADAAGFDNETGATTEASTGRARQVPW